MIGVAERRECAGADADEAELRAVGFTRQQAGGGGEQPVRQHGGIGQAGGAGAADEAGGFQFQGNAGGGELLFAQAGGEAFAEAPEVAFEGGAVREIGVERGFGADGFGAAARVHGAGILEPGAAEQGGSFVAEQAEGGGLAQGLDLGDAGEAEGGEAAFHGGADAGQDGDGFGRQQSRGFGAEDGETAGLVAAGGELGQQAVGREADADGDADLAFDLEREAGQGDGGRGVVEGFGAGEIEIRFVDGERHQLGREAQHEGADLAGGFAVFGEIGFDDGGVGAELQRLEHGHGAAHAADAGDVAGGGDDAAGAAADDDGGVGEIRAVALFDAGEEGVAVDMGDVELEELRVAQDARAAAGGAGEARHRGVAAVSAEGGFGGRDGQGWGSVCGRALEWTTAWPDYRLFGLSLVWRRGTLYPVAPCSLKDCG